jgi:hypothetical protein
MKNTLAYYNAKKYVGLAPVANITTVSYKASAVKIYNAISSPTYM